MLKFNKGLLLVAVGLMSVALPTVVLSQEGTVADQINTIEAQMILIRKQEELRQVLTLASGSDVSALPKVVSVYGLDKGLFAKLLFANGIVSSYKEGETIKGSMKVIAITTRSVFVSIGPGKKAKSLPLEFVASSSGSAGGAAGFPGAPMPSPIPRELLRAPPSVGNTVPAPVSVLAAPSVPAQAAPIAR